MSHHYQGALSQFNHYSRLRERSNILASLQNLSATLDQGMHYLQIAVDNDGDPENRSHTFLLHLKELRQNLRFIYWNPSPFIRAFNDQLSTVQRMYSQHLNFMRDQLEEIETSILGLFPWEICGYALFSPGIQALANDLSKKLPRLGYKLIRDPNHTNSLGQSIQHIWFHPDKPITVRVKKNGQYSIGIINFLPIGQTDAGMEAKLCNPSSFVEWAKVLPLPNSNSYFLVPGYTDTFISSTISAKSWNRTLVFYDVLGANQELGLAHLRWR